MVKKIHCQAAPTATTLQIMQKIHDKKGIPIHDMELTYENRQLEEDKSLAHYGINNGSTIVLKTYNSSVGDCPCEECKRMEQKVTITVIGFKKPIQVECKLGQPVEALKKAIKKKEKIAVAKQKLTHNGVELEDHKLLSAYLFRDEEAGGEELVVHMFIDNEETILDKLCRIFSFKGGL